jgi:hypothetical protein
MAGMRGSITNFAFGMGEKATSQGFNLLIFETNYATEYLNF